MPLAFGPLAFGVGHSRPGILNLRRRFGQKKDGAMERKQIRNRERFAAASVTLYLAGMADTACQWHALSVGFET